MATQIRAADIRAVVHQVSTELGLLPQLGGNGSYLFPGDRSLLISGWHHYPAGWSRGWTYKDPKRYVGSRHDGGRYEGRGWKDRMAQDIVVAFRGPP